jgi:hypothetical protein
VYFISTDRIQTSKCTAGVLTAILAALRVRIAEQCAVAPATAIATACTLTSQDAVFPGTGAVCETLVRRRGGGSLEVLGWGRTLLLAGQMTGMLTHADNIVSKAHKVRTGY